jgi:rhamnosyltransferase
MVFPPIAKQICAIITTYRPESRLVECVQRLTPQLAEIIIVDDGDSKANVEILRRWFKGVSKVTLWHQPANSGIAAALNIGVNIAQEKGYKWLLTLDDDSIPDNDMVERLCEHLVRVEGAQPVGIIGMNWATNSCLTSPPGRKYCPPTYLDKRGIITSGSLFSLSTYAAVGPFREEFFIDSVDYDFCMRARAKGFRVIQVQEFGFKHSLGQDERFKLGIFTINSESHSPARLYYAFRNSTILAKEYFRRDPLYSCAVVLSQLKTVVRIVFLQNNKGIILRSIIRGYVAAFKHDMGKIKAVVTLPKESKK